MVNLLALPDELLLIISENLVFNRDRFAFAATCAELHQKLGGAHIYKQVAADERAFDEARLRLSLAGDKHLQDFDLGSGFDPGSGFSWSGPWSEIRAANLAKFDAEGDDYAAVLETFALLEYCTREEEPTRYFPETYHQSLLFRAIRGCSDVGILEQVFDAYLQKYPAAIHGTKHGRIEADMTGAMGVTSFDRVNPADPPVWLACELNRVDVLELLHAKGVNINLVKNHLIVPEGGLGLIETDESRWDEPSFDPHDGVRRADAWNQFARAGMCADRREDVSLWLAERGLGFPSRPNGLTAEDLSDAAGLNHARLVGFLVQHLRCKLSREEYCQAVNAALRAAIKGGNDLPYRRARRLDLVDYSSLGPYDQVFEALVAAGADLRQLGSDDDDDEDRKGPLATAIEFEPSNAPWLLRHQLAEGATDPADVRAALHEAIRYGSWRNPHRLAFFQAIYPARAHLACDPARLATPAGREAAMEDLLNGFIRQMGRWLETTRCCDVGLHIVDLVGRERVGDDQLVKKMQNSHLEALVVAWRDERRRRRRRRRQGSEEAVTTMRWAVPTPPEIPGLPPGVLLEDRGMDENEEYEYVKELLSKMDDDQS
ncbi:hypothetical protein PG991_015300 [Apiospora marii]|uniref:F-box domain-containing protein n=1 Tax=Apiospora marii TaxID=335849 RepID=A0ABR1R191_9PEZI